MNNIVNFVDDLLKMNVTRIIGVLGSGDSLKIIEKFLENGGEFVGIPHEFSAPVIASAVNKFGEGKNFAASISIRGPGLASSIPGLYYNYMEDLKSLSISESLNNDEARFNKHKLLDATDALRSIGFNKSLVQNSQNSFDSDSKDNISQRMLHLFTRSETRLVYARTESEMCNNQAIKRQLEKKKKYFVFGKRGVENLEVQSYLLPIVPFFLTPAALPYVDLTAPNYLGVWTGNEQFKDSFYSKKIFASSIIIRVGVMKRELLTLKENYEHLDLSMINGIDKISLNDLMGDNLNSVNDELKYFNEFKKSISNRSGGWSVYSMIDVINNLNYNHSITFDVGSFATVIENYLKPRDKFSLHSSFISKFMGTAVATAIGACIAKTSTPGICILGEGGFSASYNDLSIIAALQLPICILVLTDNSMNSIIGKTYKKSYKDKISLPLNYNVLKSSNMSQIPSYCIKSSNEFELKIDQWDKKSPIIFFLEFNPDYYVKGVKLLR
ncbi:hypothetical protein EBU94_03540 [bacterium]|nr:hypothetical protein [bacterium]